MNKRTFSSIHSEILAFCQKHADADQAARYARYFKEGYDAYGIPREIFEQQTQLFLDTYKTRLGLSGFLDLGDRLMQSGKYEEASFAVCFLQSFHEEFAIDTFHRVGQWLETGVRNWGHTDYICGEIIPIFFQKSIIKMDHLAQWRDSQSKWKRRAVPVSLIKPMKAGNAINPYLQCIEPLMEDPDRMVQQGMGWFLREAWKRHPKPVEAFLLQWKETAPRKIYQYATEKMTAEQKKAFRRDKKKPAGAI